MKKKKYRAQSKPEPITVNEDFIPYYTKSLDSKHRITLGGKLAKALGRKIDVEAYQVFLANNGDILLRPTVSIPSKEAWIYENPEVIAKIRRGLKEASEGKIEKSRDVDEFIDTL